MSSGDSSARRAAAQVDWLVAYQERCAELVEGLDPDAAANTRPGVDRGTSLRQFNAMTPPPHDSGEIRSMAGEPDQSGSSDGDQRGGQQRGVKRGGQQRGSQQRGHRSDPSHRGQVLPHDRDTQSHEDQRVGREQRHSSLDT